MKRFWRIKWPAVGMLVAFVCLGSVSAAQVTDSPFAAVDGAQFLDFIESEVFDIQDLAEGAEIQRRSFSRMTPPGFSWTQPMSPPVVPFAPDNFNDAFLDELLGEDKNSVAIYPLSLVLDSITRETLVFNAEGQQIAAISAEPSSRVWPEESDPARVILHLDLLPFADVEPYLYAEFRIAESAQNMTTAATNSSAFSIVSIQHLTNGNTRLTVTNGTTDAAEIFVYTMWHTSSVAVVVWTNDLDEVSTNDVTLWDSISPNYSGIDSEWEYGTANLPLTGGVGIWEDANISSNARVRFYAAAKLCDSDADGLSDGSEVFLHYTNPENPDSDGDGLSDYEEIALYGTHPQNLDSDNDGLPDAWEVLTGLDPLDNGTTNPDNSAEGDLDGDGFSNALELELGSPPDNPAWNGRQLAYRLTHARTRHRAMPDDLIGLRVDIDDSSECGGSAGAQNRTDTLVVPELMQSSYVISITVDGAVEDVDVNYDIVSVEALTNTFYFSGSYCRPVACRMISKTKTCDVQIAGNSTVHLRYNTVGYKWHQGAFAEIVSAECSEPLKILEPQGLPILSKSSGGQIFRANPFCFKWQVVHHKNVRVPYHQSIQGRIDPPGNPNGFYWTASMGTLTESTTATPTFETQNMAIPKTVLPVGLTLTDAGNPSLSDHRTLEVYRDHLERDFQNFGTGLECGIPLNTFYWTFARYGKVIRMPNSWNCFGSVWHSFDGTHGGAVNDNVPTEGFSVTTFNDPIPWQTALSGLQRGDVVSFYTVDPSTGLETWQHAHTCLGSASEMYGANNEPVYGFYGRNDGFGNGFVWEGGSFKWWVTSSEVYYNAMNAGYQQVHPGAGFLLNRIRVHRREQ